MVSPPATELPSCRQFAEAMAEGAAADAVLSAVSWAAQTLRTWSLEGPPGNQRAAAGALAAELEAVAQAQRDAVTETDQLRGTADEAQRKAEVLDGAMQQARKELASRDELEARLAAKFAVAMAGRGAELLLRVRELEGEAAAADDRLAEATSEAALYRKQAAAREKELHELRRQHAALCLQVRESIPPVSVMCRIRPVESYKKASGDRTAIVADSQDMIVEDMGGRSRKFRMDRVLDGGVTQEDVFGVAAPWVESVNRGGSACVLAYGATGSGKTFTLQGDDGGPERATGLAHHALARLVGGPGGGPVRLSVVEVYCDQIRDLLGSQVDGAGPPTLQCTRRDMQGRMLLDCEEVEVDSFARAEEVLQRGYAARATDATLCNERSSRSHIVLTARSVASEGQLVLVDLAGSENVHRSGADDGGKLLTEAKAINKSLSALADVVEALAKRQGFVPYRNSRLTMLLEDVLNQAKILLLVHVSPFAADAMATGHSLQFAGRVRSVDFGAQMLRKDQEQRLKSEHQRSVEASRRLEAQVDQLRKELSDVQKEKREQKQQIAQLSEQAREQQRELSREKELRSRLEAAGRAVAAPGAQDARGARAAEPSVGQPAAQARAVPTTAPGLSATRRRMPTPPILHRGPRDASREPFVAPTPPAPPPASDAGGLGGRPVLGDLTNKARAPADANGEAARSPAKADGAGPFGPGPRSPAERSAAMSPARGYIEYLLSPAKPVVRSSPSPVRLAENAAPESFGEEGRSARRESCAWRAPEAAEVEEPRRLRPTARSLFGGQGNDAEAEEQPPAAVTPILKRTPTNFAARVQARHTALIGRSGQSRLSPMDTCTKSVTFCEQEFEAASPPKWYFQFVSDLKAEFEQQLRERQAAAAAVAAEQSRSSPQVPRSPRASEDESGGGDRRSPGKSRHRRQPTPPVRHDASGARRRLVPESENERPTAPQRLAWQPAPEAAPRWRS